MVMIDWEKAEDQDRAYGNYTGSLVDGQIDWLTVHHICVHTAQRMWPHAVQTFLNMLRMTGLQCFTIHSCTCPKIN